MGEGRDKIKSGIKTQSQGTWRRTDANKNLIKGNEEKQYRKEVKMVREKVAEKEDPKEIEHSYCCPEENKNRTENENENWTSI